MIRASLMTCIEVHGAGGMADWASDMFAATHSVKCVQDGRNASLSLLFIGRKG